MLSHSGSTLATLCAALSALSLLIDRPAFAQETAATAAAGVEEIVVTSRRRGEESLQDVSIAVTVLSEEMLRKSGISDLAEVASRTPSFTFGQQIGNQQEVVIRGIGTLRLTGSAAEPSVGLFLDEVYIGRRGTATPPLFDLGRIEVVRGPQGTLYGKNVVGGAINLITGMPSYESSGRVSASYGQFDVFDGRDIWEVNASVTGGLSQSVAGRFAAYYRRHEGYSQSLSFDEHLDDQDTYALRGSLLFEPNDRLDIRLSADFSHNESNGQSRRIEDDPTIPGPGPTIAAGLTTSDVRESDAPYEQWEDQDTAGITARFDYSLSDAYTLTYLSALRYGQFSGRYSLVGTTSPPALTDAANAQLERYTGITQDLRLSSSANASLSWVTGLYFLREETSVIDNSIASSYLSVLGAGSVGDILDGEFIYDQQTVTRSTALYGELTWQVAPKFSLTAGGRYTYDDKDYRNRSDCVDFGAQPDFIYCVSPLGAETWDIHTGKRWSEFTPKVSLDWAVTDAAFVYVSAARGFKGGGWQGKPGTQAAALLPYDPELAWTYEAGAKTEWLSGRLRVNAAVFHTSFDDLQVEQIDDIGISLIIDNAASARIDGIELELQLQPLSGLKLWLNGSYIDSEYKEFIDSTGRDLSGNQLARTPQYSAASGVEYQMAVSKVWMLGGRVEYQWRDEMPWGVENSIYEAAYGVFDARLWLEAQDGAWEAALYGKNLTNELYRVDAIPFLGDVGARFAAPRSFGVQLSKSF